VPLPVVRLQITQERAELRADLQMRAVYRMQARGCFERRQPMLQFVDATVQAPDIGQAVA